MNNKSLLYFVVNNVSEMVDLWKITMDSILFFSRKCIDKYIDILVITNTVHVNEMREYVAKHKINVIFVITNVQTSLFESRMQRLHIHKLYPELRMYNMIMYMDYDCIVKKCLWHNLLKKIYNDDRDGILYSYREDKIKHHNKVFYSFGDYITSDFDYFYENELYPFSSGIFVFKNTHQMKVHFRELTTYINDNLDKLHFYEQSAMNVFFNKAGNVDTKLMKNIVISKNIKPNKTGNPKTTDWDFDVRSVVVHFCGIGYYAEKKKRMLLYMDMLQRIDPCLKKDISLPQA